MTKKDIIKKALKYLAMLKTGKSIRTQYQSDDLRTTMELLESMMYENWEVASGCTKNNHRNSK